MKIINMPEFRDKSQVFTLTPDTLLMEAVRIMAEKGYGCVIIVEKNYVKGIFTERDLLRVVAKEKAFGELCLQNVMTTEVKTANKDDLVNDSLRRMSQGRFRHLPVVDKEGRLQGLVSQGDLVAFSWPQLFFRMGQDVWYSFSSNTQLWMVISLILGYSVAMFLVFLSIMKNMN